MGRTSRPSDLLLALDRRSSRLLRDQVVDAIAAAIADGRLRPGTELPATRALAADLGVSRGVVVEALAELRERGLVTTRGRALARIADALPAEPVRTAEPGPPRLDLAPGLPDVALFPRRAWLDALRAELAAAPDRALAGGDPGGAPAFRVALADALARSRGARVGADRALACQGGTQAIELACRLLAADGARTIAVEDPCLPATRAAAERAGLRVVPAPVDERGLRVDRLPAADAVLVAPAHQWPTGVVLAPERRRALLDAGLALVEDDRGADLRLDGRAPAVLQGEAPGRVLLVGSASLALAPGLRCGWLVVPPRLAPRALELRAALDGGSPAPEQLALARLLATAGYERHVRRVRAEYARRRDALVAALRERFGADAVGALDAGLHVALALPEPVDRAALATRAAAARVRVVSLEEHRHEPPPYASTLLVGHARVPGAAASEAVRALARLVDPTTAPGAARALPRRPSVRADAGDLGRGAPGQTSRTLRVLTLDLRGAPEELVPAFVRAVEAAEADVLLLQNTLGRTQRFVRALGWPHAIRALNIAARVRLVRPGAAPLALAEVDEGRFVAIANIHLSDEAYGPWALAAGAGPAQAHDAERRIRLPELAAAVAPLAPLAESGVPVVLGGTVNGPLEPGWPVADALAAHGLVDAWRDVHGERPGATWPAGGEGADAAVGDRIDGLFCAGPARALAATLVGEAATPGVGLPLDGWPGDHRGLVASFEVVPGAVAPCVGVARQTVTTGETAVATVLGLAGAPPGRVSLVPATGGRGRPATWRGTAEAGRDGRLGLPTAGLRPGAYDVVLELADGAEAGRAPLWIAAHGAVPAVATGRRGYTPGEPIAVSWSDAPGNAWDWIGLYAPGAATDVEEPLAYAMTYGRPAGTARLDADLAPGPYLVGLFLDDTGTLLAATEIEVR